jgi:RHS repeat-associated protein
LQPVQIGLGTSSNNSSTLQLDYIYHTTTLSNNNGIVLSQQIVVGAVLDVTQTYEYDELNRLQKAEEKLSGQTPTSQWKQTFSYDRFGNRKFEAAQTTPASVLGPQMDFSASNNRITTASYDYDSAGNVKQEPASPANKTYAYDGENHQVSYSFNGATTHYVYDGDGKRVMKWDNTGAIVYVYDALGRLAAEYTTNAPQNNGISYLTSDHLGSTRVVSGKDGSGNAIVKARYDYLPFGEELPSGLGGRNYLTDNTRQKFTGHERDPETKLDFAQARYCSSATGRFMSPDDFLNDTHTTDPQSWNLFAYVRNNPLRFIDPNGQIKKDKDGNIITEERKDNDPYTKTINGKTYFVSTVQSRDGRTQVVWEVKKVTIFADNGDKVKAYQTTGEMQILTTTTNAKGETSETLLNTDESKTIIDKAATANELPLSNIANCHGTTFAQGQLWIENDQVGTMIKGDGYRELGKSEKAQVGDVGIYGNANHSVRVNSINPQGVVDVISKGGITRQRIDTPGPGSGTAWNNPSDRLRYFTQRSKPKK